MKSKPELRDWLLQQQYKQRHPYTGADAGRLGLDAACRAACRTRTIRRGRFWLLALWVGIPVQRMPWTLSTQSIGCEFAECDGGWPTFCRGWGHLPFDRSGTDLTAHCIRAIAAGLAPLQAMLKTDHDRAWLVYGLSAADYATYEYDAAFNYLTRTQRPDGSWLPLWFGNQHAPDDENPTYGTARVLAAYRDLDKMKRNRPGAALPGCCPRRTPTAAGVGAPIRRPASRRPPWPSKCCSTLDLRHGHRQTARQP